MTLTLPLAVVFVWIAATVWLFLWGVRWCWKANEYRSIAEDAAEHDSRVIGIAETPDDDPRGSES